MIASFYDLIVKSRYWSPYDIIKTRYLKYITLYILFHKTMSLCLLWIMFPDQMSKIYIVAKPFFKVKIQRPHDHDLFVDVSTM